MSHLRQKKRGYLSKLSSIFQSRPPSPNNAVEAVISATPLITPTMFSGIEQVHIGVGNFSQNIYNVNDRHDNVLKHLAFQSLPRSCDAAFSAAINLDNLTRRSCTDGTRVDIIAQIMTWVEETNPTSPPVYWLTGLAGLGKTTIAYTICERLNEAHLPFASFFCSLQLDSKNSKLLVTTLCRDLAEFYDSYAANVLSTLETNPRVVNAGLRIQINELLAKPWQAQRNRRTVPTPIVVVDALDESDRGTEFLEEILRVVHAGQLVGVKFLVTSRPDPKIVSICKSFPPSVVCKLHEIDTANVQSDIEKYLREALPELEEPEIALLSQRAGGLFIYATTAVRFISPPYSPPSVSEMRFHLQTMLKPGPLTSHPGDEQFLVDELYERILGDAFRDARVLSPRLRILHTIICAESRIKMSVLADLTNTDQGTVERVVESLHAVLFVSPKDGCVYWYHASFPDFVFSHERAKIGVSLRQAHLQHHTIDLFCDPSVHHGDLAQRCFSVMQESLYFNMCNLPSSCTFDSDVPGLEASIEETFSPTLQYVSRNWARHLVHLVPATNSVDDLIYSLKEFLCNKLLFWIEVMNLIGAKSECSSLLKDVKLWAERGPEWPDLLAELTDGANFSAFFAGSPASKSTPHLYISALSMWNQDSAIWRNWRNRFAFIPSISLLNATITIPLMTIRTTGPVKCIAFSPDGNRIVTGSFDKSVRVWDTKTGEQLKELQGHTDRVESVSLSPNGSQIVSGSFDKSVWVWDTKTGERLRDLQGHTDGVSSVAFSPDGNRIVTGSFDKSVRLWDAQTGEQLKELQGHTGEVWSVAFSPDGNQIASGSFDKSILVWDAKTGERLRDLQGHTDGVSSVTFSPDSNQIVSGSFDKSVRLWDPQTGEQLKELQGHTGETWSVAFSSEGNQIVSGPFDKFIWVWDARTGERLRDLQGHTDGVSSVTFSPDGNRIVSGSFDKSVRLWDAQTGEQLKELQGHTGEVWSVAFSPDGNQIVSGSFDESVWVWDAKTVERLRDLQGHTAGILSVAFSPDGHRIISGSDDESVRVWDAKTGEQLKDLQGHTGSVSSVAFSPDGNRIVSGSDDESVRLWDAQTGKQLKELQGHTDNVSSVAFSPDGNRIVSGSFDKSILLWDAKTGKQLRELQEHTDRIFWVAFSPNGNQIVSGSDDQSVRLWDVKTGKQLSNLQGHTDRVLSVAFSPDGSQVASGSDDKSVRIWDAKTCMQLRVLHGHTDGVSSVTFSPDGNRVLSGSFDKSVRMWNAKTGMHLKELQGHTDFVWSVAFSSDGTRIVSGSSDKSVRVWGDLNLDNDAPWVIKDGWLISGVERLVLVPSTICNVLLHPHNILTISRNGSAAISFVQCKLGSLWQECYTP